MHGRISSAGHAQVQRGVDLQARAGAGRDPRASRGSARCSRSSALTSRRSTCCPVGATRRDWKQTLISDGMVIVRHPELETALAMADRVGTELQMVAS